MSDRAAELLKELDELLKGEEHEEAVRVCDEILAASPGDGDPPGDALAGGTRASGQGGAPPAGCRDVAGYPGAVMPDAFPRHVDDGAAPAAAVGGRTRTRLPNTLFLAMPQDCDGFVRPEGPGHRTP